MKALRPTLLAMVVCTMGASCPLAPGTMCTLELRSTVSVRVIDARNGSLIGSGATVVISGPEVSDSAVLTRDDQFFSVMEDRARAGRYTVTVRKPGYVDYVNDGVRVTGDECHVQSRVIDAPLTLR